MTGEPSFEVAVRGEMFLDTHPPTGARAVAAIRPLRVLPPGLHTIDRIAQHPVFDGDLGPAPRCDAGPRLDR